MMGLPELRQAVAAHYQHWQNLDFDPDSEIMITSGATEAIAGALMALIEPGDEVVLFQPLYDAYLPLVQRAGGVPRFVRLEPPHWRFTEEKLARAFTPKHARGAVQQSAQSVRARSSRARIWSCSRAIARNSTRSRCATRCGSTSCSTGAATVPLIAMPGMRERCVKIGSAGKIFSLTGWKVGLRLRGAGRAARARQGAPVHHLHDAAEPAGRGGLRARQGGRLFRGHARATCSAAATASPTGCARSAFR